jgi:hypothetical protein
MELSVPYSELPSAIPKQDESFNITSHQTKMKNKQLLKCLNKVKSKVIVISDSHARNCAQLLQDNLSTDFKTSSVVKPGACMKEVTNSVREELKTMNSDYCVVVWGGANDIRKNNMKEALKSLSKFVKENNELNIVLINSPQDNFNLFLISVYHVQVCIPQIWKQSYCKHVIKEVYQ